MKIRRGTLLVAALCVAILGAGMVVYTLMFRDPVPEDPTAVLPSSPQKRPTPPPPPAPKVAFFDVIEVIGEVDVRRVGGDWQPLRKGDRVLPTEAIRTGTGARAVVRTPSGDELTLRQRVELSADVLNDTVTELTLTRGRVRAAAGATTERLRITSNGAEAVGPAGSRFTVFADVRGAMAIASEAGDVKVIGQGEAVTVSAGRQTYVPPGGKPRPTEPIPDDVFLAVSWPKGEVHARKVKLTGRVRPGTEVEVNGALVTVSDDGLFEGEVPLRPGRNPVRVEAETVDGRRREAEGTVTGDTTGPPLEVDPLEYETPPTLQYDVPKKPPPAPSPAPAPTPSPPTTPPP